MAGEDDSEEKSHEPTDKRKEDARKEGQVLTSKEAFVFASLGTGTGMLALMPLFGPMLLQRWTEYFRFGANDRLEVVVIDRLAQGFNELLLIGIAFAAPIAIVVMGLQAAMGGLSFNVESLGFKFSKLDPLKGMGRMVSMNALVELSKGLVKVSALGGLSYMAMWSDIPGFSGLGEVETPVALSLLWGAILGVLGWLCLGLAGIGVLDFSWQFVSMRKKLMMSFQELKEESKEQNGSPEVKGRVRQLQMEASRRGAKERGALGNVPSATAIVTNPIHFAVALRYIPGQTAAPEVVAMGKGPLAQEIIALGKKSGVHVLQSPPLARALYFTGDIGLEISDRLFGAVAAVLAHVYRLNRGEASDLPDIELPDDLMFSEYGRLLKENHNAK